MKKYLLFAVVFSAVCASYGQIANGQTSPNPSQGGESSPLGGDKRGVLDAILRVNNHWQATRSPQCRGFWDNAAYFTGNQAVYELTGKQEYLDYALAWAEYNHWKGATQTDKSKWEYATYGEDMNHVLLPIGRFAFRCISTCISWNIGPKGCNARSR